MPVAKHLNLFVLFNLVAPPPPHCRFKDDLRRFKDGGTQTGGWVLHSPKVPQLTREVETGFEEGLSEPKAVVLTALTTHHQSTDYLETVQACCFSCHMERSFRTIIKWYKLT